MANNDRILIGQNNAGESGFWVSKPGSDVSTVVASKASTTTHWYTYQEEFDWTGVGGSSYATSDPGGSSFVSNGAGLKRTSGSPGADGGSILYFGNGSPSYIETSLDGTEQFLGSTYTVVEMRIRANTSATGLPATSEPVNDLKLTWDAFPLGESSPVNFHAGNLTGNGLSAGYGREKIHGNTWEKTFLDDGWIVLEWDMSGVQAWTDPNAYMQSLDGGANLHPPSIKYRINKLKFELTENDYTGTIDPLWEIDYVRVKKAGIGPSAGRQSQSFVKELAYDFDATHSAMVHQTGTVTCGVNLAWRDGKTSNRRGNDVTVDHGVNGKGEIDIVPPLPYVPVIIFQRVDSEWYDEDSIPATQAGSGTKIKTVYPGGEQDFSYSVSESQTWKSSPTGFIIITGMAEKFTLSKAAEIRTFAYLRAQKDKFWITCRNAIASDGYEPMLNFSTSERISDHEFGSNGPINDPNEGGSTLDLEAVHPNKLRDYWIKPAWEVPEGTVGNATGVSNAWPHSYGTEGDVQGALYGRVTQYNAPTGYYNPSLVLNKLYRLGGMISTGSETFNDILKFKSGYGSWGQFPLWALRHSGDADGLGEQGSGIGYQDDTVLTWGNIEANADVLNKHGYDSTGNSITTEGDPYERAWAKYGITNIYTPEQSSIVTYFGRNKQFSDTLGGAGPGGKPWGRRWMWTWAPYQGTAPCWDSFEDVPALLPNEVHGGSFVTPQINPGYSNWSDGTQGDRWINSSAPGFLGVETFRDPWPDPATPGSFRPHYWQFVGIVFEPGNHALPGGGPYDPPGNVVASRWVADDSDGPINAVGYEKYGLVGRTYEPEYFGGYWRVTATGGFGTGYGREVHWTLPTKSTGVHHPYGTVPHRTWDLQNYNSNFSQPSWSFNSATDNPDDYDFRTKYIRNKDTVTNQTSFIGGCPNKAPAEPAGTTAYTESEVTPPIYRYYILTIPANADSALMG